MSLVLSRPLNCNNSVSDWIYGRNWRRSDNGSHVSQGKYFPKNNFNSTALYRINDTLSYQVCKYELGLDDAICANLTSKEHQEHQLLVQRRVNGFEITRDWVCNAPPLLLGMIAGALSDQFGRKPLMIFPLVGDVFE